MKANKEMASWMEVGGFQCIQDANSQSSHRFLFPITSNQHQWPISADGWLNVGLTNMCYSKLSSEMSANAYGTSPANAPKQMPNPILSDHVYANKMFSCEVCSFQTGDFSQYKQHLIDMKHTKAEYTGRKCDCKRSNDEPQFDANVATYHTLLCSECGTKFDIPLPSPKNFGEYCFKCNFNGTSKKICYNCQYLAQQRIIPVRRIIEPPERVIKCESPEKTLDSYSSVRSPTIAHSSVDVASNTDMSHFIYKTPIDAAKRHQCVSCEYSTNNLSNLRVHARKHTGEKPFKCELCNYASSQRGPLKVHMVAKHSSERPYKCDLCKHASTTRGNLMIHMRTHTKEKPYACEHCTFRASQLSSLKCHRKNTKSCPGWIPG